MPRPAGVTPPTQYEQWQDKAQTVLENVQTTANDLVLFNVTETVQLVWIQLEPYLLFIGLGLIGLAVLWVVVERLREREFAIRRLWLYVLFFLSKRLMLIPLVHTFASRTQSLATSQLETLVTARKKARDVSFLRHPKERMEVEKEVSQILLKAFTALEQQGQLSPGQPLANVVEDLEFIDEKLVELQTQYNASATAFNRYAKGPFGFVLRLFGVRSIDDFA